MKAAKPVMSSLLELHEWRQAFNGDQLGHGFDPYKPDKQYDYAEAYALWGLGYLSLARLTGATEFLDLAREAGTWLVNHRNPGYSGHSWGLPWRWDEWNTPATLSFLITTAFAGEFFLALHGATGDQSYRAVAQRIAAWIECENGVVETKEGLWLYYANLPPLRFPVVNPTARASGFFAQLYVITKNEHYKRLCYDTARWVLSQQNADGSWYYSTRSAIVDNVHTGFTLQGVWDAYHVFLEEHCRQAALKGTAFYWRRLFTPEGKGYERKPYDCGDLSRVSCLQWARDQVMRLGLLRTVMPETRLWGYGSALRAFSLASQHDSHWLKQALVIYDYLQRNLALDDGSYAFHGTDSNVYVRHEAHVFEALGRLAERLHHGAHS